MQWKNNNSKRNLQEIITEQFVHVQVDKAGELYGTIFPKGFVFAENEIGTENNDDGLKWLFNKIPWLAERLWHLYCLQLQKNY